MRHAAPSHIQGIFSSRNNVFHLEMTKLPECQARMLNNNGNTDKIMILANWQLHHCQI
jgi:hypothetical protein